MITEFTSYLFGGLVNNKYGQKQTTNDLIVVKTKKLLSFMEEEKQNSIPVSSEKVNEDTFDNNWVEEYTVKRIIPKDGRLPLPRRDHSAVLIKNNKYIVIFGGKNDNISELPSG